MTDSTAEYLPLEKIWYHFTDEGATLPETEPDSTEASETDMTEAPTEPTPPAESDTVAPQTGCGSSAGSALALTAMAGAAVICSRRRKRE